MKKLLITLLLVSSPVLAAAPFTAEQEARIKELIQETLVKNPSILAEAAEAYDKQAQKEQGEVRRQVIEQNKQALFSDVNSPRLGAKDAKVTLVNFTDYNCVYCKKFDPELERLVKNYPQVAVVIKPLPYRSESSLTSARQALMLWRQDPAKFWQLHQRLMAKKGAHDEASIKAAEKKVGVEFIEPDPLSSETVNSNLQLAQHLAVTGTPATLIGEQLVSGAIPYEQLEALVKAQLEQADRG